MGVEIFKRDPEYATSDADGKMVYQCLSEACPTDIMLIVFTPTPFIDETDYQNCIDIFRQGQCDSVISVQRKNDYMFHNKKPVNFNPLKTCKSQDLPKYYSMTFGVTIVNTEYVKKNHSIWTENPHFYEVDELKAMDIDTNMDFLLCEEIYKKRLTSIDDIDNYMNERNNITHEPMGECGQTQEPIKSDGINENEEKYKVPDDVYLGAVYDALNMICDNPMDYVIDIKPVAGYSTIIHGPALTLTGRKIRKDEDYSAMDNHRFNFYDLHYYENSPIVLLESNDSIISHTGDITSTIFKKLGAVGYITDGIARDVELIDDVGLPVFSKGVNPIDAISNNWAYTDINVPIKINNLLIYPNDYVFASKDGVVVVPQEKKVTFFAKLNDIMDKERKIRTFVRDTDKGDLKSYIDDFIKAHGRF